MISAGRPWGDQHLVAVGQSDVAVEARDVGGDQEGYLVELFHSAQLRAEGVGARAFGRPHGDDDDRRRPLERQRRDQRPVRPSSGRGPGCSRAVEVGGERLREAGSNG